MAAPDPLAWAQNAPLEAREYQLVRSLMLEYAKVIKDWMKNGGLSDPDPQEALKALMTDGWPSVRHDSTDARRAQQLNDKLLALQRKMFSKSGSKDLVAAFLELGQSEARFSNAQAQRVLGTGTFAPTAAWEKEALNRWADTQVGLVKNLSDQYRKKVVDYVSNAAIVGTPSAEIAAKLLSVNHTMTISRAKLIARDQVGKLNGTMMQARFETAGLHLYVWRTAADERVRGRPGGLYPDATPSHWVMEGKVCRWDDPTLYLDETGQWAHRTIDMPLQHPGMPIQCRCTAAPVEDELMEGMGDALPYLDTMEATSAIDQEIADATAREASSVEYARISGDLYRELSGGNWGGPDFTGAYSIKDAIDWKNAPDGATELLRRYSRRSLRRLKDTGGSYYSPSSDGIYFEAKPSMRTRVHEMGHAVFKSSGPDLTELSNAFKADLENAWSKPLMAAMRLPESALLSEEDSWIVFEALGIRKESWATSKLMSGTHPKNYVPVASVSQTTLDDLATKESVKFTRNLATQIWNGNPFGILHAIRHGPVRSQGVTGYDALEMMVGEVRSTQEGQGPWSAHIRRHERSYSVSKAYAQCQWIEAPAEIAEMLLAGDGLDLPMYRLMHYVFPRTMAEISKTMGIDDAKVGLKRGMTQQKLQELVRARLEKEGRSIATTKIPVHERKTGVKYYGWVKEMKKGHFSSKRAIWDATAATREARPDFWEKVEFVQAGQKPKVVAAEVQPAKKAPAAVIPTAPTKTAPVAPVQPAVVASLKGHALEVYNVIAEGGGLTQAEIAKRLGLQPPQVSAIVRKFKAEGLVEGDSERRLFLKVPDAPPVPPVVPPVPPTPPTPPTPPVLPVAPNLKGHALEVYNVIAEGTGLTQAEIVKRLGLQPPQVSTIVRKLKAEGIVEGDNDRRLFLKKPETPGTPPVVPTTPPGPPKITKVSPDEVIVGGQVLVGTQARVFTIIAERGGMTQVEIAQALPYVLPSRVSAIVRDLINMGVIHHNEERRLFLGKG